MPTNFSRRAFLATSAAAGASWATARAASSAVGANDAIRLGFVGLGGRGVKMIEAFDQIGGVRVAALCDPDRRRLDKAAEKHPGAAKSVDLRRVIEADDVDAIVIATCNHWHCLAAIWACQAGKDVYVEKPLGHNLREQRRLVDVVGQTGRIVQVGTQQRSDPAHQEARRLLQEEKALGELSHVVASRAGERKPIGLRETPMTIPSEVDYGLWLGPAAEQQILRDELQYDWHWDFNTGSGEMGNWGVHILDDLRSVALGDQAVLPTRVTSAGGRVVWDDAGETPNLHAAHFENSALPVTLLLSNLERPERLNRRFGYDGPRSGYVVHGEGGFLRGRRGYFSLHDKDGRKVKELRGDSGAQHQQVFIDAVRSRDASKLTAPIEVGHASSAWCHLANIAALHGAESGDVSEPTTDGWGRVAEALSAEVQARGAEAPAAGSIEVDPASQAVTTSLGDSASRLVERSNARDGYRLDEAS